MGFLQILTLTTSAMLVMGQRPSFLPRPVGFPEINTQNDGLGDRFGEGESAQPLPIEAGGDRNLVNRLSKLPIDKQPFWFINWQALDDNRKNPQSYDLKPNTFIDPLRNPLDQEPAIRDPTPTLQPIRPTLQNIQTTQPINDGTINAIKTETQTPQTNNVLMNRRPIIDLAKPDETRPSVPENNPSPGNTRNPDVSSINLQDLIDAAMNSSDKMKPTSKPDVAIPFVPLTDGQTEKETTGVTGSETRLPTTEASTPDLTNRNAAHSKPMKQRPYSGQKHNQGYVFT